MNREIIRVGLIGLGMIGRVHARAYHELNVAQNPQYPRIELVVLIPPDFPVDETLRAEIGSPRFIHSSEDFIAEDLDLVDICTPNNLHAHFAELACRKGAHVYCEKPLGRDLADAEKMVNAAKKAKILTHVAFVFRYLPASRQMLEVVHSGMIGKPLHFRMIALHGGYLDPKRPVSWRLQRDQSGGGVLIDIGIHLIDLLQASLGEVAWVECETKTFFADRPAQDGKSEAVHVDVDDWAACTLGMANGAIGTLETSRVAAGRSQKTIFEIYGEKGSVAVNFTQPNHANLFLSDTGEWESVNDVDKSLMVTLSSQMFSQAKTFVDIVYAAHLASIEDFLIAFCQQKPSPIDFAIGLKDQETLEAAYRSAGANGVRVTL